MKNTLRRIVLLMLIVMFVFSCTACSVTTVSNTPGDTTDPNAQNQEVVLRAATLTLPEKSAFSFKILDSNPQFNDVKTALPSCGNAFLNDLIFTTVKERSAAFLPQDGTLVAVDVEELKSAGDLYSFYFALHYKLADHSHTVTRFWVSADLTGTSLIELGTLVKLPYFENGTVDEYVRSYVMEHYANQYDKTKLSSVIVAAEASDNFYVSQSGVMLVLDAQSVGAEKDLEVYISDGAIALFHRKGETSTTEPENSMPDNYSPAQEGEKVVAMTFDDGPGSSTTTRLLDYLEANHIKATFFVNGYNYSNLETHEYAKEALRRAVDLNCEIGNHSYAHPYFHKLTAEQRTYQLEYNADLIEAACGVYPTLFRAPGGIFPKGMPEADDYFYIYWDADGEDWAHKDEDPQALAQRYLNLIHSGSIVLFHDIYANSVDAAIIVMNTLKAEGYRFVTISELLNLHDKVPDGTIYTSQTGTRDYMNVELNG